MIIRFALISFLLFFAQLSLSQVFDELYAEYTFNDSNANDQIGSVHGTTNNVNYTTDRFGNPNHAIDFNSNDSYISFGDNFELFSIPGSRFSFSFWFQSNDTDNQIIMCKYGNNRCSPTEAQREFFIRINTDNRMEYVYFDDLGGQNFRGIQGNTIINDNCWHQVVINYDGSINSGNGLDRVSIFIDNIENQKSFAQTSSGNVNNIQNGTAHYGIGMSVNSFGEACGHQFIGKVDDVKLYSKNLSSSEVDLLYHQLNPVTGTSESSMAFFTILDDNLCVGECTDFFNMSSNCPTNFEWTFENASIQNSTEENPSGICYDVPGVHNVTLVVSNGYSSDTYTKTVTVTPPPEVNLGNDTTICNGATVILNVDNPNASYLWSNNSTDAEIIASNGGIYWVDVNVNDCITRDSILLIVIDAPLVNIGNDTTICANNTLLLDASAANATYLWSDNSTDSILNINSEGIYWVDVIIDGCVSRDSIEISTIDFSEINIGIDTTICTNSTLTLDASSTNSTYLWSTSSTDPTITISDSGTYWVDVTLNGCLFRDSIIVTTSENLNLDIGNDTTLCNEISLTLLSNIANANYLWSDNSTQASLNVSNGGIYWLEIEVDNCIGRDSIFIDNIIVPQAELGNDTIICENTSLELDATLSNVSYLWSNNSNNSSISVTEEGLYWVEVFIAGCSTSDTIEITTSFPPSIDLGDDITICNENNLTLNAYDSTILEYLWNDESTESTLEISESGLYYVQVTNACGILSDSVVVISNNLELNLTFPHDHSICTGDTLIINATTENAESYLWQDNSTSPIYTISSPGIYQVTIQNECNEKSQTITVSNKECCELYVPNIFSPNDDGYNDKFEIIQSSEKCQNITNFEMRIYDRWGELVFVSDNINNGWSGNWNGKKTTAGVYIFTVNYNDGDTAHQIQGAITVIR